MQAWPTVFRGRIVGTAYDISWGALLDSRAGRCMPSFFIRLRSVLGWRLSRTAAPCGPSITHRDCSSTTRVCWGSTSSSVVGGAAEGLMPVGLTCELTPYVFGIVALRSDPDWSWNT